MAYLIQKHARIAAERCPALRKRRITPHVLRHSCACALLQAGVDITVIRDYLGHSSVATTSRYITTNLQMKRDALEAFWKRAGLEAKGSRKWRPSPQLLTFLETLYADYPEPPFTLKRQMLAFSALSCVHSR